MHFRPSLDPKPRKMSGNLLPLAHRGWEGAWTGTSQKTCLCDKIGFYACGEWVVNKSDVVNYLLSVTSGRKIKNQFRNLKWPGCIISENHLFVLLRR